MFISLFQIYLSIQNISVRIKFFKSQNFESVRYLINFGSNLILLFRIRFDLVLEIFCLGLRLIVAGFVSESYIFVLSLSMKFRRDKKEFKMKKGQKETKVEQKDT